MNKEQLIESIEQQYSILDQIMASKGKEKVEREDYIYFGIPELEELSKFLCDYEKYVISGEVE